MCVCIHMYIKLTFTLFEKSKCVSSTQHSLAKDIFTEEK